MSGLAKIGILTRLDFASLIPVIVEQRVSVTSSEEKALGKAKISLAEN